MRRIAQRATCNIDNLTTVKHGAKSIQSIIDSLSDLNEIPDLRIRSIPAINLCISPIGNATARNIEHIVAKAGLNIIAAILTGNKVPKLRIRVIDNILLNIRAVCTVTARHIECLAARDIYEQIMPIKLLDSPALSGRAILTILLDVSSVIA